MLIQRVIGGLISLTPPRISKNSENSNALYYIKIIPALNSVIFSKSIK